MAEHDDNRKKKFTFVAWERAHSGLQATFPKADETVKSTPNRDKFNRVNSHQG